MDPNAELRPGRFSDRFVAYLLDTVPFAVGAVATVWVWGGPLQRPLPDAFLFADGGAWILLAVLWQVVGNVTGGTVGNKLLGLRVVTATGAAPGFGRALARAFFWLAGAPLGNFGFWIALFHPKTRALHDMLSGTFVVEDGPRRSNGAMVFVVAAAAAVGLFVLNYWSALLRPTDEDIAAIIRAEEGLGIIAQIEDAYHTQHGTYSDKIQDLAEASGDVETFRKGMLAVFSPSPFFLQAGNRGWRVTAAAKDRRRTRVHRDGP
jgi:uncharacterized RDD family membrane protein YckC